MSSKFLLRVSSLPLSSADEQPVIKRQVIIAAERAIMTLLARNNDEQAHRGIYCLILGRTSPSGYK